MSTKLAAIMFLTFSTILCFFTNSWLTIWILLEINTLAFCSMEEKKESKKIKSNKEALMKYLIVQSIASAILILVLTMKKTTIQSSLSVMQMITLVLMIKMAAAPFHFWFIEISKKSNWFTNILLFTWQKAFPLYLINVTLKTMILPFILISTMVGSIFLMNKKSLKEILALSSVFNLGWLLSITLTSLKVLLGFLVIYWISLIYLIKELTKEKMNSIEESKNQKKSSIALKTINLAGIPPLMLFTVKWTAISSLLKSKMILLPTFLLVLSSVNIYIYLRMLSSTLLKNASTEQKSKSNSMKSTNIAFIMVNLLLLQMLF